MRAKGFRQMHNRNRWISHDLWHCDRRLAGTFPASMEKCWYAGCVERCGGRPALENRPRQVSVVPKEVPKEEVFKPLSKKGRGSVRVVCHHCKTPIYRKPSDVSRNKSGVFFCTPEHSKVHRQQKREIQIHPTLCAWKECNKGQNGDPAPPRSKSIYCSRDCSNKNARLRHRNRKKAA